MSQQQKVYFSLHHSTARWGNLIQKCKIALIVNSTIKAEFVEYYNASLKLIIILTTLVRPVLRSKIGQEELVEHALFNSNVLDLFGLGFFLDYYNSLCGLVESSL